MKYFKSPTGHTLAGLLSSISFFDRKALKVYTGQNKAKEV
jgi:hypothetical protein